MGSILDALEANDKSTPGANAKQQARAYRRRNYYGGRPRGFHPKPEGARDVAGARLRSSEAAYVKKFDQGMYPTFTEGVRAMLATYKPYAWLFEVPCWQDRKPPNAPDDPGFCSDPWHTLTLRLYAEEIALIRDLGCGNFTAGLRSLMARCAELPRLAVAPPQIKSLIPPDRYTSATCDIEGLPDLDSPMTPEERAEFAKEAELDADGYMI